MVSTGIISRLVKSRGFGFIKCSGGHEVFFHRSYVYGDAFELLAQGQNARFKVGIGTRGLQAIDIRPITEVSTSGVKKPSKPTKK
jgi:cold shock CspA family protein